VNITIRNLYSDLELISPVYFSTGTICYLSPSQQTDIDTTIEAIFGIDSKQKYFKGALLYKLQRKYTTRTDNHSNGSTTSIEDATTNMYLLVAWNIEDYKHGFCVCLIECTDDFTWDEDKLYVLCREYGAQLYKHYKSSINTWLIHSDAIMKTRFKVIYGSDYELNIVISEGTREDDVKEPMKIDPKRLVLPLSIMIVLIHDC
jgi:hypothetical protein